MLEQGETARLAELPLQAYDGEPGQEDGWHGPSLRRLLSDVDAERAARRPVAGRHSIWELVLHIAVWDEICERRLGGELIRATTGSAEDWPAVGATGQEDWRQAGERLTRAQQRLVRAVAELPPARLDDTTPGWSWSNYRMVHGTLHHDLYHAGQIALLKRAAA